jgi:dethiobiotin synthase
MVRGVFVTGTDTDVGKTFVSTLLTVGLEGNYWKPIQTGSREGTDSQFVEQFVNRERVVKESYCLKEPLSPNHASEIEGISIDYNRIHLPKSDRFLIVEGAGGVLVPLGSGKMMIDLIRKFNFPCLVVARSGLGTLNHTLLTISELRRKRIPLLGVALNGKSNPLNRKSIEHYGRVRVLFEVDHLDEISELKLKNTFNERVNKDIFNA